MIPNRESIIIYFKNNKVMLIKHITWAWRIK